MAVTVVDTKGAPVDGVYIWSDAYAFITTSDGRFNFLVDVSTNTELEFFVEDKAFRPLDLAGALTPGQVYNFTIQEIIE